jgi:hypothetical protein
LNAAASLDRAFAMLGKAVVPVIGTAAAKERAALADAGELADAEALALAAEVEALAGLLGGRG